MILPKTKGIYVADVQEIMPHRKTKHCVCLAIGDCGRFVAINTDSRPEYGELKINASDYTFLKGVDRFILYEKIFTLAPNDLLKKVGELSDADVKTLYVKIEKNRKILVEDKEVILEELKKTFK